MRKILNNFLVMIIIGFLMVGNFGCAVRVVIQAPKSNSVLISVKTDGVQTAKNLDWEIVDEIKTIYFRFDDFAITEKFQDVVINNAVFLAEHTEYSVFIAGHCDERGSDDYNYKLGLQRAKVIEKAYIDLGIPEYRIKIISYGKRFPLAKGHDENSWAENRRAITKVRKG